MKSNKITKANNLFENLNLSHGASDDCVRKRVKYIRKILHPDWYSRHSPRVPMIDKVADKIREVIDKTADILLDSSMKNIYTKLLTSDPTLIRPHGGLKTPFETISALILSNQRGSATTSAGYRKKKRRNDDSSL